MVIFKFGEIHTDGGLEVCFKVKLWCRIDSFKYILDKICFKDIDTQNERASNYLDSNVYVKFSFYFVTCFSL